MSEPNHGEALLLAAMQRGTSNLARCYIDCCEKYNDGQARIAELERQLADERSKSIYNSSAFNEVTANMSDQYDRAMKELDEAKAQLSAEREARELAEVEAVECAEAKCKLEALRSSYSSLVLKHIEMVRERDEARERLADYAKGIGMLLDEFVELNPQNYTAGDVSDLQGWASQAFDVLKVMSSPAEAQPKLELGRRGPADTFPARPSDGDHDTLQALADVEQQEKQDAPVRYIARRDWMELGAAWAAWNVCGGFVYGNYELSLSHTNNLVPYWKSDYGWLSSRELWHGKFPGDWRDSIHRVADTDEHGLPVIPRPKDAPEWAKYVWSTYGGSLSGYSKHMLLGTGLVIKRLEDLNPDL